MARLAVTAGIFATLLCSFVAGDEPFVQEDVIPVKELVRVKGKNGKDYFISENRRYVVAGKVYDLWRGGSIEAGFGGSTKIDLERNGVNIERVSFPVADQRANETLVISPDCADCIDLLSAVLELDDKNVNIMLLATSDEGRIRNGMIWCSKNRVAALKEVFIGRKKVKRSEIDEDCNTMGLMQAHNAAMLFGIGQLPMYIDENENGYVGASAVKQALKKAQKN